MTPLPITAVAPLGSEWTISPIGGLSPADQLTGGPSAGKSGFGGVLASAVSALEQSQANAAGAAQALATGQLSDPTQAITAVEDASLQMQLAGQIRTKAVEAAQDIFHTQI